MIERIRLRLLLFQIHSILWLYVLLFLGVVEGGLLVLPLALLGYRTSRQHHLTRSGGTYLFIKDETSQKSGTMLW
jgi:hypothetical protein